MSCFGTQPRPSGDHASVPSDSAKNAKNDNLPWVEKYRPSVLEDIISHASIINTVSRLIESNQLPHLLFYGPPGTGKTSTIHAVARKINGPNYKHMILELNASDDRKIEVVRDRIQQFASSKSFFSSGLKLVILDEADSMTRVAQFALRRVIETHAKSTRFCLLGNYMSKVRDTSLVTVEKSGPWQLYVILNHQQIIPALQSRCMRFRFGPLASDQVREQLKFVSGQEGCNVTSCGLGAIIKLAHGDMRNSLNLLQVCHVACDEINESSVYSCTGNPLPSDVQIMMNMLNNMPMKQAYEGLLSIQTTKGLSLKDMLTFIHELVLRISYPPPVMNFLLSQMSNIENRLSSGSTEHLQLASLVGIFKQACHMTELIRMEKAKQATLA